SDITVRKNIQIATDHAVFSQFRKMTVQSDIIVKQKNSLEKIFSADHFLLAFLDRHFNFIRVNKGYADMENTTPEYFIGKNHFKLYPHEENKAIFSAVIQTGQPYTVYAKPFVFPLEPQNEVTYWDWSLFPLKDPSGTVEGLVLILVDVTERKRAEKELADKKEELKNSQRLADIGYLASTIAHELKNPISVIGSALYNIRIKRTNPAIDKQLGNIEKKIEESANIINNLLFYTRLKKPNYETVDVTALIRESISTVKRRFFSQRIALTEHYPDGGPVSAELDPIQIGEVLNNLLVNAYQACKEKTGAVDVYLARTGGMISIAVRDDGIGIAKDKISKIFDPFFTTKSRGTGLGLSICLEMIRLHKGTIDIDSEENKGTTVVVSIPFSRPSP
ncbi:MAG: PAS domain-containing protein, partial [Elusimicrobia bacterium]|nr:PAS domain-containing protein [Elusimicrobiota bacterium]MBD3412165.1 PAS domain-containing protein [Elusimicrobiota bacterium]